MRIPIVRGRDFSDADIAGRPAVILISESMAREFWSGQDPIGKRLTMTFFPGVVREIVGVVGDVKIDGLDQTRPSATLYVPASQVDAGFAGQWRSFPMTLVVRTANSAGGIVSAATNAVHEVDPELPVRDVLTMNEVMANSVAQQRFNMMLLGAFGVLALFLAAIGIYSVLSYSVRRRVQEIGIRLALGARLADVLRMVVVEGMKPVLFGVVLGIAGAFALGRLLASLIYAVRPTDPLTFFGAAVLLALISLLACMIPAYRATRVDPLAALRYE
jgi:putative ABC transport system permease protein